jgi:hypothetical protein
MAWHKIWHDYVCQSNFDAFKMDVITGSRHRSVRPQLQMCHARHRWPALTETFAKEAVAGGSSDVGRFSNEPAVLAPANSIVKPSTSPRGITMERIEAPFCEEAPSRYCEPSRETDVGSRDINLKLKPLNWI